MPRTPQQKRAALTDAITRAQAALDKLDALPAKAQRTPAQDRQAGRHAETIARQTFRALRLYTGIDTAADVNDPSEA